jgi:outer membrane protein OmpA-like peptidoglycan-associated protein
LTAREEARRAQAPVYAAQPWQEAEVKMKKAARTLEDGNLKSGLKQIPEIEKQYRKAASTALRNHPQPDVRTMTNSLEEQSENIAELKQEIELRDARVHSLEQQVAALERKMGGKNGTSNHTATNGHTVAPRIAADASLQSYFSKDEALVFRKDSDIVIRLYDLDFFANTGQLSSASAGSLWRVGEILRKHPYANVIVAGHVFSERDQATNLKLSRERAEAVKRYLIQNRLANQSIVAIGFGDTAPIPQDELIEGPIRNQRIDVIVEFGPSQMSYLYRY